MSDDEQRLATPADEDLAWLAARRKLVEALYGSGFLGSQYQTVEGKLAAVQPVLGLMKQKPDFLRLLQGMGIVLGDAFCQEFGMTWVMVEDWYGRDPALALPGTSVLLFPLAMISKRVERGEEFEVADLFHGVGGEIRRVVSEGA